MTNLADLLPAGGGQNNTDFVADGNVSAGAPVVLTAAGKAAPVTSSSASLGSEYVFESARSQYIGTCFMGAPDNVVITTYRDNANSGYGTAVVAQIYSNGLVSYGTPVVFSSSSTFYTDCAWDESQHKILVVFQNNGLSSYGQGCIGTVSGTSISFTTPTSFRSAAVNYVKCAYDASDNTTVVAYQDQGTSSYGATVTASISGSSITWSSVVLFNGVNTVSHIDISYDSTAQKCVVAYSLASNGGYATVLTTSSGAVSAAMRVQFSSNTISYTGCSYDSTANKTVFVYSDDTTSIGYAIVATVSGTTTTYGAAAQFLASTWHMDVSYNSYANKSVIAYGDQGDGYDLKLVEATVAGTSISFSSALTLNTNSTNYASTCPSVYGIVYKTYIAGDDEVSNEGVGYAYEPSSSNLTSTNLLGLAPEAISDTATGTINTWGSRCENSSFLGSALSAGSLVAFETSGSPSALSGVAFDANAGKMVIAYTYGLNGYAIVGTVSGTSASYGTAVIFQASAAVYSVNAAYDANAQKVVIIYTDGSNSDYPTAIVGTVSGTSISFGTKVAFLSSGAAGDPMSIAYDANAQKVVIGFRDTSNSNYGTGIVGTVSGTSISFGTKTAFNSSATLEFTTVYDSDAQKVAIGYRDAGNLSYGTAVVGTVSGTSISFGSPQVFLSAQTDNMGGCFDSTNNKVVFCYRDTGNSDYGTAIVGTISGTSISFGSSAVYNNGGSTSYNNASYDAGAGKVIISYAQGNAATIAGTVSGTSISFDTAVVLDAGGGMGEVGQAYDSTNAKTLIAFQSAGNSYHGYSATATYGDLPLTVASDYYVQTDGSLSTDTGGQLIGKAIKTNQINIKDYTG
jgi:viroplasmin and RNaseH domain-containing protein